MFKGERRDFEARWLAVCARIALLGAMVPRDPAAESAAAEIFYRFRSVPAP